MHIRSLRIREKVLLVKEKVPIQINSKPVNAFRV